MASQATDTPPYLLGPGPGQPTPFVTQHSTPENQATAEHGLILLTEIGSTMHGVSDPSTGDDIDEMGVCIEDPRTLIGLTSFEQYEYRTQPVNHRSGPGDVDRVVYSLRKFVRLAAQGNPTVLMPLFADRDLHVRYCNMFGQELRGNAHMFLSKQAGHKFLGYLNGQISRYLDSNRVDSTHASRPELIEKYGWDTKTGYHAIRLAFQGIQLMTNQSIELPMFESHRGFLLKVRQGAFTKSWVTAQLEDEYVPQLKQAIVDSTLPERPDYARINEWLSDTYQQFWHSHPRREIA